MHVKLFNGLSSGQKCAAFIVGSLTLALFAGCGGSPSQAKNQDFFTSGSPAADQRASERMAQSEELSGSGEGAGEKDVKSAEPAKPPAAGGDDGTTNKPAQAEGKLALYARLGGEEGLTKIVADFLPRAMQDPRVNWERHGVTRGGFSLHRDQSETWTNSPENVALLQKHFIEFLSLATGGPSHYEGKEMKSAHANMHISNPEFDATIGDLKVTLDRLQVPNKEQKELLAIVESTRPEIVTEH
jgi:hemoglobin